MINEIVKKIITINYNVYISEKVGIKSKFNNKIISLSELISEITYFFADTSLNDLINEWYKNDLNEKIGTLKSFLNNSTVELGTTAWIVKSNDGLILTESILVDLFDSFYTEEFIIDYYDEWYMKSCIEYTEKIMGFNI